MKNSRTLRGVRGLKCCPRRAVPALNASHPSRGAWIEIVDERRYFVRPRCRTLRGVRGLKSISISS